MESFQVSKANRIDNSNWPNWMHVAWNTPHDRPGALFPSEFPDSDGTDELVLMTNEGPQRIEFGGWVVRGTDGTLSTAKRGLYPVAPT